MYTVITPAVTQLLIVGLLIVGLLIVGHSIAKPTSGH